MTILDAVKAGDIDTVRTHLDSDGTTVNEKTPDGSSPLHLAASGGHTLIVQLLLSRGAQVDALTTNRATPLHYAVYLHQAVAVNALLAAGANVNLKTGWGPTALELAFTECQAEIAASLLRAGAHFDGKGEQGDKALQSACLAGHTELVTTLLALGCNPNYARDTWTPLHHAVDKGHSAVVTALLENGADANARNGSRETPLYIAAQRGRIELTRILLAAGARHHLADKYGQTPLIRSAVLGHADVVVLLLGAGADIRDRDVSGDDCLALVNRSSLVASAKREMLALLRAHKASALQEPTTESVSASLDREDATPRASSTTRESSATVPRTNSLRLEEGARRPSGGCSLLVLVIFLLAGTFAAITGRGVLVPKQVPGSFWMRRGDRPGTGTQAWRAPALWPLNDNTNASAHRRSCCFDIVRRRR